MTWHHRAAAMRRALDDSASLRRLALFFERLALPRPSHAFRQRLAGATEAAGAGYQQRSGQELGRLQSLAGDITVRTSSVSDGRGRSA